MCWEVGQRGFCPLPFLATSLHTALSARATPRALMFLCRRSAHAGSCPPGKLRGHLNSFPALDNRSAATKIVSPGSSEPSGAYLGQGCSQREQLRSCTRASSQQKKQAVTWWLGSRFTWVGDGTVTTTIPSCSASFPAWRLLPPCKVHKPLSPFTEMQRPSSRRSKPLPTTTPVARGATIGTRSLAL